MERCIERWIDGYGLVGGKDLLYNWRRMDRIVVSFPTLSPPQPDGKRIPLGINIRPHAPINAPAEATKERLLLQQKLNAPWLKPKELPYVIIA